MAQSFKSLLKHGGVLSLLTLASRVLGLLREMSKAALLGTSALSDAFSVAFMIPNLFRRLFAEGSISAAFIPTFKEYLIADETDPTMSSSAPTTSSSTNDFLSCFTTFLTFFVSLAVAAGILATPLLVRIFGIALFDETVFLTRFMFPYLAFISIAALFQGILNTVHIFTPSGLAPIALNIVTIACAWLLSPYTENPARAFAIGIFAGGFLEAAIQAPFVLRFYRRQGFRFAFVSLRKALHNEGTRKVLRLIVPTIIGMAAYQVNDLVSTALAGRAGSGIVSSLQYSLRLQELILGVFAVSIGTVLLPNLAEYAKSGETAKFQSNLRRACLLIAFITIPVTFFSFIMAEDMIRLLYQTRRFNDESVALTVTAFRFHIAGLFFIALNRVLAPAFYAQSDSKRPTAAGIASFIVNMALAALLAPRYKGAGIAFALSFASVVNTALLLVFLKEGKLVIKTIAPLLGIVALSLAASFVMTETLPSLRAAVGIGNRLARHGIPLLVGMLIFAAAGGAGLVVYMKVTKNHANK